MFNETVRGIRDMSIRGAARIGISAVKALRAAVEGYSAGSPEEMKDYIRGCIRELLSTRPTAVSLKNALVKASIRAMRADDVEGMKRAVAEDTEAFIRKAEEAKGIIGKIGARRVEDGKVYMTHCSSSAAISVFRTARESGKEFTVVATETRPWRQGMLTVRALSEAGVDTKFIVDSAARHVMREMDVEAVFVGADAISSTGTVVNKIGTSMIALAAHENGIHFYVCAESFKFSTETLFGKLVPIEERPVEEVAPPEEVPGVEILNPVFDATPAEYITGIITESGIIPPHAAYDLIVKEFGDVGEWSLLELDTG